MKFSKFCVSVLFVVCTSTSIANKPNPSELRASFDPLLQKARVLWDQAALMKFQDLPQGQEISQETCEALKWNIAKNYQVSPFHVVFLNGESKNLLCNGDKQHLLSLTGNTEFGQIQQLGFEGFVGSLCGENGRYTKQFNRSERRDGPLFRSRYKSILIDAETCDTRHIFCGCAFGRHLPF
ncbi:MAG: hypothetical protein WCK49_03230 [Myxococcaceae bacterium]